MNEMLSQIILLARRSSGTKDWGNILFIAFLAIVWAIGGILKAKKNAQEKKAVGQGVFSKPVVKPDKSTKTEPKGLFQQIRSAVEAELQQQRELQEQAQQGRKKMESPRRPAVRKVSVQPEGIVKIYTGEPAKETEMPSSAFQVEPKIEIFPEFSEKIIKKDSDKQRAAASHLPRSRYLSGILSDYSKAEELKRLILHYEILGRPLSLREPSERFIQ